MSSSPLSLFSLPAEVRCNIYSHLFEDVWLYISARSRSSNPSQPTSQPQQSASKQPHYLPPLLNTCIQLREEASPFFYRNLTVYFDVTKSSGPAFLAAWLNDIGTANASLIRHFEMRWCNYVDISLDLRCKPETLQRRLTDVKVEEVRTHAYNKRLESAGMARGQKTMNSVAQMRLLNLSVEGNPTSTTKVGAKHSLKIQGVPISTFLHPSEYWQVNGTAAFCEALAMNVQGILGDVLDRNGGFKSVDSFIDVLKFADEHASTMRWLWYW